jgi:hypothetical protein
MLILRNSETVSSITDPAIRSLAEQRFVDICDGDDYDEDVHGFMIVVEAGDSVADLERESSCPILCSPYNALRFGDAAFRPCFEVLEEHEACYELVYVISDGGFGVVIFIPTAPVIDPELLSFCSAYATPAPEYAPT